MNDHRMHCPGPSRTLGGDDAIDRDLTTNLGPLIGGKKKKKNIEDRIRIEEENKQIVRRNFHKVPPILHLEISLILFGKSSQFAWARTKKTKREIAVQQTFSLKGTRCSGAFTWQNIESIRKGIERKEFLHSFYQ